MSAESALCFSGVSSVTVATPASIAQFVAPTVPPGSASGPTVPTDSVTPTRVSGGTVLGRHASTSSLVGCDDRPMSADHELTAASLPADQVGLLEGIATTRAIRRYLDEPVPPEVLRAILFAATRAPSGSNRQPFRMMVLTDGPKAAEAKRLIAASAQRIWGAKREIDSYDMGSGVVQDSPKARTARVLQEYVDHFERVPALIIPCLVRYRAPTPFEGGSIYPACQNILLAARALGYGGVMTGFHAGAQAELHRLLEIPEEVFMAATITLGRPRGSHGPVRRRPLGELIFEESWGESPTWAVDPPGTRHTSAGPPRVTPAIAEDDA
jgi:nitroreductase